MATTADEVWQLLGELLQAQKETERRFQETERRFQEGEQFFQETQRLLREQSQKTDQQIQEVNQQLREQSQKTDRQIQQVNQQLREQNQKTDRQIQQVNQQLREQSQKTDRQIQQVNQQLGKLGNRLGEFVEWQVRPAAVRLFQERGIDVHELHTEVSVQRSEGGLEIDLLVVNETTVVLIEVKSKLTKSDVDEHLERLAKFKQFMPRYRDANALGAVAAMVVPEEVSRYAYRRGLFVLAQSGENVMILNNAQFEPRVW